MTSEEIKQTPAIDLSANSWLREICLQLALLNEKGTPAMKPAVYNETLVHPEGYSKPQKSHKQGK